MNTNENKSGIFRHLKAKTQSHAGDRYVRSFFSFWFWSPLEFLYEPAGEKLSEQ